MSQLVPPESPSSIIRNIKKSPLHMVRLSCLVILGTVQIFVVSSEPAAGAPSKTSDPTAKKAQTRSSKDEIEAEKAQELMNAGKTAQAKEIVDRILRRNPDLEAALYVRAQALRANQDYQASQKVFVRLIGMDASNAGYHAGLGQCHMLKDELPQALREANLAIGLNPTFSLSYFVRGCVYFKMNRLDKSGADFMKFRELAPTHDGIYPIIIDNLTRRKLWVTLVNRTSEWIDARVHEKVMTANKAKVLGSFYAARAEARYKLGDEKLAADDASIATQLNPGGEDVMKILDSVEAPCPATNRALLQNLNRMLKDNPNDMKASIKRTQVLARLGNLVESRREAERLVETHPGEADLYELLADIQIRQKDFSAAIDTYTKMFAKTKEKKIALWQRACVYKRTGKLEGAVADYSSLLALEPDKPEIYFCRSRAYEKIGQVDQAVKDRKKAYELLKLSAPN